MYKIIINTSINDDWNQNLIKSDYANFFQNTNYLDSSPNTVPIYISVLDDEKNVVGQLGLNIINTTAQYSSSFLTNILKLIPNVSRRGIWFFGPIIHTNNKNKKIQILKELLKGLDIVYKKYNIVYGFGFASPYDSSIDEQYLNELKKNGYLVAKSVTYLADLSESLESLWGKISKKTRGDISRAERRGISVKQIKTYDELQDYIQLYKIWTKTKGLELSKSAYNIEKIWNNIQSGLEVFFLAYQNNEIISGLRLTQFNKIIYTYQVLSSYSNDTSLGGTLLTWKAIEWSKQQDCKIYDFSGGSGRDITKKEEKLLFYKKKWGGNEVVHTNMEKINKKTRFKIFKFLEVSLGKYRSFRASR